MQLDKEEWIQEVKSALKNWHHPVALSQSRLCALTIVAQQHMVQDYPETAVGLANALRDILRSGINSLGAVDQPPPSDESDPRWFAFEWRVYSFLTLRYVRALSRGDVQQRIGLAEGGQYYKVQRDAVALLATLLQDKEGVPADDKSILSLTYPSGAMNLSDPFYIERQADFDLKREIQFIGRTITITGPRQVGKTSMLVRAMQEARVTREAKVVYLDLQSIPQETLKTQDGFFLEFAYIIFDELGLEEDVIEKGWASRLSAGRKLTKLIERHVLSPMNTSIIFALDEVDRLLLTDYHADFFGLLRSWHNLRSRRAIWEQFSLLMAISTEPYLLINDLQQSPFNVGLMLYLHDFDIDRLEELNARYGRFLNQEELPLLLEYLGGQPYLTRVALYTMVKEKMTYKQLSEIALAEDSPFIAHLRYQKQMLLSDTALKRGLKQVLTTNQCQDDMVRYRLLKAGLIKQNGHDFICRCALYHQYFAQVL